MFRLMLLLSLFLLCSSVAADELPIVKIVEGDNTLELAVVNVRTETLHDVRLVVDETILPGWLAVDIPSETLDAPTHVESGSFVLRFTVTNAPDNAVLELPFTLRDGNGGSWDYAVLLEVENILPERYDLFQNVPNPFNPSTTISYALKETVHTCLTIYNSAGQKVRTLIDVPQNAGVHSVVWDGANDSGAQVSSGVYFYRLDAGGFTKTTKMLLTR